MSFIALFAAGRGGGGGGEWIVIVIAILIAFISLISKLLGQANKPPQKPRQPGQRPQQGRPPQRNALDSEIEEFMRRAAERRGRQSQRAEAPPRKPVEKPVVAEVVKDAPIGSAVVEHVQEYLNTGEFAQRSNKLGGEVTQEVAQLDERLHNVFDHQLSSLASQPGESSVATTAQGSPLPEDQVAGMLPVTAAGITALLSDPENIRQAIILNEILRRPEERWG
jgi:hypothetical protein